MFTTEDQREEMLALKAKKPAANTATTVFSAPQVINPVGLNVGFRLENSALEAEKKQQEYAEHAAGFAEAAIEKEWWGKTEDATAFWKEASRMDGISKEYGAKAQFFRELSHNPGLLYASPKGAPKPITKAPSPMFKSSGTAAATQPSGGFGNAQNTQITPISPLITPQTASARERRPAVPAASDSTPNTSAPSQDYIASSASLQEVYKAYKEYEKTFQNEYSHRDDPESAYGYHDAYAKLQKLKQNYLEQVDYLMDNASTFEANLETPSVAMDRGILQLQLEKTIEEMWDYYNADPAGTDPKAIIWYIEQIAAIKSAMNPRLNTTYQDGPAFKERLVQMGNSATSGIAGSLVQSVASTSEWISQYTSIEGDLAERNATLNQLLKEYNSYLDAGIPEDNILVVQLKEAIDNTRAEINYIQSGQRSEDRANARQELYLQADEYYDAADAARNSAVEGLGTVGTMLVDGGIEGLKVLFDIGVGFITGGTGAGSSLVRSFADGAHESADEGKNVNEQIANGLKAATIEFLTGKILEKGGVLDKFDDGLIERIASSFSKNQKLVMDIAKIPVAMTGAYLTTFMFACADTAYNNVKNGEHNRNDTDEVINTAIENFISGSISYVPLPWRE